MEVKILERIQISLAAARVNAGLTQADVAKALNVGKQTIVSWEKGRSEPKMSQSRELSLLYRIPLDYIFLPQKSN
ncbi:helix-turn-helix domain-containing protein [Bacteroides congonensis]|uniref:helix-turn-helix transcriptional regulator n=1 Tax=Bacteroides congonensis TaxID=1871006 RepID=UPI00321BAE1E